MKKCVWVVSLLLILSVSVRAQSHEAQQLLLNVEKLAQLKQMLSDLKKGYDILVKGTIPSKTFRKGILICMKLFWMDFGRSVLRSKNTGRSQRSFPCKSPWSRTTRRPRTGFPVVGYLQPRNWTISQKYTVILLQRRSKTWKASR